MSSNASRFLLQPPRNARMPLLWGSKLSPAMENRAEGPSPVAATLVHTPVSTQGFNRIEYNEF